MDTSGTSPPSTATRPKAAPPTDVQHLSVFWEWCMQRETGRILPQMGLVAPLLVLEFCCWMFWPNRWSPVQGRDLLHTLAGFATLLMIGGGASYAAQAVCWEVSPELRELVRLTGIGPVTLLGCKTLARWSTIGCSLLLLIPLVCFAWTLGGVTLVQLWAYGWILLMLAVLTAGMALFAGVSSTESQNASTTAALATLLLLLMYHMIFWLSTVAILLMNWGVTGNWGILFGTWWQGLHNFAWQSAPITILIRAGMAPELFSPLAPPYWIHLITAVFACRISSVVMINRFRSIRSPGDEGSETSTGASTGHGRPRCTAAPFFWKDAYILSGGTASRRRWSFIYGVLAVGVLSAGLTTWNWDLPLTLGIIAESLWPMIFAIRIEALFAAEFRMQTWPDLMLLPIDRRILFWSKMRAVAWEQRGAIVPVVTAITFAWPRNPTAVFMTGIIATLAGLMMCQTSAINFLTPRKWWTGPLQIGFILFSIGLIVTVMNIVGLWFGFGFTIVCMLFVVMVFQSAIDNKLRTWSER